MSGSRRPPVSDTLLYRDAAQKRLIVKNNRSPINVDLSRYFGGERPSHSLRTNFYFPDTFIGPHNRCEWCREIFASSARHSTLARPTQGEQIAYININSW